MPLDPILRAALRAMPTTPAAGASLTAPDPARRRAEAHTAVEGLWAHAGLPIPEVAIETVEVPVAEHPAVTIRIHRPSSASGILPGLVTFFGGAFRQGGNDSSPNRWAHATRAIAAGIAVVAVDYALAPEHRFPAQIEQGLAVLDWISTRGADHGIDASRIAVGGQSSGANIAAAVAQWNLDRAGHPVRLQVLEVPVLDLTGEHADLSMLAELGIPDQLVRADRESVAADYLPDPALASDPAASPLLRDDLTGLPPAVILAAEYDPLRGDASAYHARLREAGVPSAAMIALGQSHDSNGMVGAMPGARLWQDTVIRALRSLHD